MQTTRKHVLVLTEVILWTSKQVPNTRGAKHMHKTSMKHAEAKHAQDPSMHKTGTKHVDNPMHTPEHKQPDACTKQL
jgi:hypothetical protein